MKGNFKWRDAPREASLYTTQDFAFCGYSIPLASLLLGLTWAALGLLACAQHISLVGFVVMANRTTNFSLITGEWCLQHFRIHASMEARAHGDSLSAGSCTVQANKKPKSSGEGDEDATITGTSCFWCPPSLPISSKCPLSCLYNPTTSPSIPSQFT